MDRPKQRTKPWTTNSQIWKNVLNDSLVIPMSQREYEWGDQQILEFLEDIYSIFDDGKDWGKMGSIIMYNEGDKRYIYDGQQRTITILLILLCIGRIEESKICLKKFERFLFELDVDDEITERQKKFAKKHGKIIPNIEFTSPLDMENIFIVFNNDIKTCTDYTKNLIDPHDYSLNGFTCKHCDKHHACLIPFKKHIKKEHKFEDFSEKKDKKIIKAYEIIYDFIKYKFNNNNERLKELFSFILNNIDIQVVSCSDSSYVHKIFEWENNRGLGVDSLDIVKNLILSKIINNETKTTSVYDNWQRLKQIDHHIYSVKNKKNKKNDYGQKIFNVAIQIFNKKFTKLKEKNQFKTIINSKNILNEIEKFFHIIENLQNIMKKIGEDKYGKILLKTKKCKLPWEAYGNFLLPIFYLTKSKDISKMMDLMCKWYFRNYKRGTKTFNSLCYSHDFIKIVNEVIKDNNYDYKVAINECFNRNKCSLTNEANYISHIESLHFSQTVATQILMYIETKKNTDVHIVPPFSLEHIFCQKNKVTLDTTTRINYLGNLTLLEGKSSKNGHKGNYSLGDKPYSEKRESYKRSSSIITREVSENYNTWNENDILKRGKELALFLEKQTRY